MCLLHGAMGTPPLPPPPAPPPPVPDEPDDDELEADDEADELAAPDEDAGSESPPQARCVKASMRKAWSRMNPAYPSGRCPRIERVVYLRPVADGDEALMTGPVRLSVLISVLLGV